MFMHNRVYPFGLLLILAMPIAPGCSDGDKPPDELAAPRAAGDVRTPLADIGDLYRAGKPEEARQMTLRYMNECLDTLGAQTRLEYKIAALNVLAGTVEVVTVWEQEFANPKGCLPDEASRKAVATCLERMEQGNALMAKQLANAQVSERERRMLNNGEKSRAKAIKNWILMNPADKRVGLYRQYEQLLKSQNVNPAEFVETPGKASPPTPDQLLLKSAKADIEQIRKLIGNYYRAIFNSDAEALRATLSEKSTAQQISRMLAKWTEEKKKHAVEKVSSVDVDGAGIEPREVVDNRVVVAVKGVKVTIASKGQASTIERENTFQVVKENERWVLWFQY